MSADLQVLQAVLAHQRGLLTREQLVHALAAWADRPDGPGLLDLLGEHSGLTPDQRSGLEDEAAGRLADHAGDSRRALAGALDPALWHDLFAAVPALGERLSAGVPAATT